MGACVRSTSAPSLRHSELLATMMSHRVSFLPVYLCSIFHVSLRHQFEVSSFVTETYQSF
eukprot:m.246838 g.246838  ORF g.246838 m.246838 type:complete len:60 (+) comp59127_c0_seq1:20-199(+)